MRDFPRQHYFQRCNHGFTSDGVTGLNGTKCFFFLWKSVYVLKIEAFWRSGSIGGKFGWESSCCASLPIPSHSVSVATDSPYLQAPLASMQSKLIKTCLHCLDTENLERKKEKGGGGEPPNLPKAPRFCFVEDFHRINCKTPRSRLQMSWAGLWSTQAR